jgi:hypothetical protein
MKYKNVTTQLVADLDFLKFGTKYPNVIFMSVALIHNINKVAFNIPNVGGTFRGFTTATVPFLAFGCATVQLFSPSLFVACCRSPFSLKCIAAKYNLKQI